MPCTFACAFERDDNCIHKCRKRKVNIKQSESRKTKHDLRRWAQSQHNQRNQLYVVGQHPKIPVEFNVIS